MSQSLRVRRLTNAALFLGPASVLLLALLVLPILVDLVLAFTDMNQSLRVTRFTTEQFAKMGNADPDAWTGFTLRRAFADAAWKTLVFVACTLLIFNTGFALVLALATSALPAQLGAFFRAVWLLPRMSPSLVYALLWIWTVDPTQRGLLNQILAALGQGPVNMKLDHPMTLVVLANGFIGASLGMIILTSAIRAIPEHLFHAARVDGAGPGSILRHIVLPALRWPLSYILIFQLLALLVSFEYIFLIMGMGPATMTLAVLAYTKSLAPGVGAGQYAYGAAITLLLIAAGIVISLALWRLGNLKALLARPRIEVE